MKNVSNIIIWIIVLSLGTTFVVQAQVVEKFRPHLPEDFYTKCMVQEVNAKKAGGINEGVAYLDLGRKSLTYSELLAIQYEEAAEKIFLRHGNDSLVAQTRLSLSLPYINMGKYEVAEKLIDEVNFHLQKKGNPRMQADLENKQGYLESSRGNYALALKHYLKSKELQERISPKSEQGDIYNRIGMVYRDIGDYNAAFDYFDTYIRGIESGAYSHKYYQTLLSNAADCLIRMGKPKEAKPYLEKCIIIRKQSDSSKMLAKSYQEMTKMTLMEGEYQSAQIYIDSSLYYAYKFNNQKQLAELYLLKSTVLDSIKSSFSLKLKNLLKARQYAYASVSPEYIWKVNRKISEIYYKTGDYKKAIDYNLQADSVRSELFNDEVLNGIKELEKSIVAKSGDDKIAMLKEQNKLKTENLAKEKKLKNFYLLSILLLAILIGLLLTVLYQRSNNNAKLMQKNNMINKALLKNKALVKEIHHRVKNNLQVVSSLLSLQSRYTHNQSTQEALITGKSRVQAIALLHQSLYQNDENQKVHIKRYFEDLCDNISEMYKSEKKSIRIAMDILDIELDLDVVVTIGLIVNELIINAIKHAFSNREMGLIQVRIHWNDKKLQVEVKDDGIGLPFDEIPKKSDTLGFQLIAAFAHKLEAAIIIDNTKGASIRMLIDSSQLSAEC